MASSKEKAVGLKDAYVAGLLDSAGPEAAAEAGAGAMQELAGKLGMEQGQQASILLDIATGKQERRNDGIPYYIRKGAMGTTKEKAGWAAYPQSDGKTYAERTLKGMDLVKQRQRYGEQVGY